MVLLTIVKVKLRMQSSGVPGDMLTSGAVGLIVPTATATAVVAVVVAAGVAVIGAP